MLDNQEKLDFFTSPAKLADALNQGVITEEVIHDLLLQKFNLHTQIPLLSNSIYKSSLVGIFNDSALVKSLFHAHISTAISNLHEYNTYVILNISYICPDLIPDLADVFQKYIRNITHEQVDWLWANPESLFFLEPIIQEIIININDADSLLNYENLFISYAHAKAAYGVKPFDKVSFNFDYSDEFLNKILNFNNLKLRTDRMYNKKPLLNFNDKPNVAVCITGQIRGIDTSLNSWVEFLQPDATYDFYVSSWMKTGSKNFSWPHIHRLVNPEACKILTNFRDNLDADVVTSICEKYFREQVSTNVDTALLESRLSNYGNVISIDLKDDLANEFINMNNSEKMYYHNYNVGMNLISSEREYDIVVKLRPDTVVGYRRFPNFWKKIRLDCCFKGRIFAESGYRYEEWGFGCGDQLAIGSQSDMKVYFDTYDNKEFLDEYNQRFRKNSSTTFAGHTSLGIQLWSAGIDVTTAPLELRGLASDRVLSVNDLAPLIESLNEISNDS